MRLAVMEWVGAIVTVLSVASVPFLCYGYQDSLAPADARLVRLTGVMKDGVWTDRPVHGLNYWRETFEPATVELREGEEIVIELLSSDVTHGFYVPELGVGPVQVKPGTVKRVRLRGDRAGRFEYYCTSVCGDCHHFMRGFIVVQPREGKLTDPPPGLPDCAGHLPPTTSSDRPLVQRGAAVFAEKGCHACHGEEGVGGVSNFNYPKQTVPDLAGLAERLGLFWPEDADLAISLLEDGKDLAAIEGDPPFERYARFVAQYENVRNVIRNGSPAASADESRPEPPLHMPSWEHHLTERDIDAVIAWALTLYPWEEYDEEEDGE